MQPVLGGASHTSQSSMTAHFGLGSDASGTVDIMWPGGVYNRLYDVSASEGVVFPEIPCSFMGWDGTQAEYETCVSDALSDWSPQVS